MSTLTGRPRVISGHHSTDRPKSLSLVLAALVATSLALAGCGSQVGEWHQKLTVTVETPDGIKTGSSVMAIKKHANDSQFRLPDARAAWTSVRAEAVVVEVAPGRYLFALVSNAGSIAQNSFPIDRDALPYEQEVAAVQGMTGVHRVPRDAYPRLVTFANVNAPQSVGRVDPDNLAASFGPGYRLVSITLEITDEPITEGRMEEVLGWLKDLEGGYLHGGFTSRGAPLGLTGLDFARHKQ